MKRIKLTEDDLRVIIKKSVGQLLREENVWDNGENEAITNTKDMTIKRSLLAGIFHKNHENGNWEILPQNGVDVNNMESMKKYVQNRLEIMKNHLDDTLNAFESKMNNLDENIQMQHTQIKSVEYVCEVCAEFNLPSMNGNPKMRYIAEEEEKELRVWCEQKYGNGSYDFHPSCKLLGSRPVPGVTSKYIKIGEFKATGYTTRVSFELSGYQLGGLRYVGMVVPFINSEESGGQYADVKLTDEFASNIELENYLKSTSSNLRCDSCGRKSSRDLYFIFMDENDKLHYYGRTCAQKVFGIDIINKLQNFMVGLDHIGEIFAQKNDDFNIKEDMMKKIIASMMQSNILTATKFKYELAYGMIDTDEFNEYFEKNKNEIDNKYNDFIANAHSFFESIDDYSSDFDQKIKAFGLAFTSGNVDSFRKVPKWVIPYALNKYFRFATLRVRNQVADENGNIIPYGEFGGYKTFYGTVIKVSQVKTYNIIMAKASDTYNGEEKYGIMWYEFNAPTVSVGDKISISGPYSKYNRRDSKFTVIDRPKIENIGENEIQQSMQKNNYDVGQRLRNCNVTVKKVFQNSIIVTTDDGFDFLIYTMEYGTDRNKFGIDFTEGQKLNVTGTIQMSPNNRIYLNRCQISLSESIRKQTKLTENYLHRVINESIKKILRELNK